jgi:DNA invertase Pin-like site-specific DNA recombinase
MESIESLFKVIDEASDREREERDAREAREFARRKEVGEQLAKCKFLKHVNGLYAKSRCTNPIRTMIELEEGFRYRDCLSEDCPLIK